MEKLKQRITNESELRESIEKKFSKFSEKNNDEQTFTRKSFQEIKSVVSGQLEIFKISLLEEITLFNDNFIKKFDKLNQIVNSLENSIQSNNVEITNSKSYSSFKLETLLKKQDIWTKNMMMKLRKFKTLILF